MNNQKEKKIITIIIIIVILVVAFFLYRLFIPRNTDKRETIEPVYTLSNTDSYLESTEISISEQGTCDDQYNNILKINNFDFDKYCFNSKLLTSSKEDIEYNNNYSDNNNSSLNLNHTNPSNHSGRGIGLAIIIDASGSMISKIDNKRKIDIAKKAAVDFLDAMKNEDNLSVSIITYGHKGTNTLEDKEKSCNLVEEIYPFKKIDISLINTKINNIDAHGWTPMEKSLIKAKDILKKENKKENLILLISDGKESCSGHPVKAIESMVSKDNIKVRVDVIGFDVSTDEEKQLLEISRAGNGEYYSAKNSLELKKAFESRRRKIEEMNYKIFKTTKALYDMSSLINNYNQCNAFLEEERASMMLDLNNELYIKNKCSKDSFFKYKLKYNSTKQRLDELFLEGKNSIDEILK